MKPGSAKAPLILVGVLAVEVIVTALSVCSGQALEAVQGLLIVGAMAFGVVWAGVMGHRFIQNRLVGPVSEPEPWVWKRPWLTAFATAVAAMGIIAALGVVALTQPARCG